MDDTHKSQLERRSIMTDDSTFIIHSGHRQIVCCPRLSECKPYSIAPVHACMMGQCCEWTRNKLRWWCPVVELIVCLLVCFPHHSKISWKTANKSKRNEWRPNRERSTASCLGTVLRQNSFKHWTGKQPNRPGPKEDALGKDVMITILFSRPCLGVPTSHQETLLHRING
jgi:hypothetical protein